ncbi:MAG: reverse transcriptase domain-containing protein, partial [Candidatus Thiodiazotropha sp.]
VSSYIEIKDINHLKLRPIVAGPACQTHRISNLLDILLKPFTKHVTSFLRDINDFLNSLPNRIPKETILATSDVELVYSNIPHSLELEAINFWIEQFSEELPERFSKEFVIESLRFILENNTFQFNDEFFRQKKGTAMGTKVAPTYATLTIGYLEQKLYNQTASDFGPTFIKEFENTWKRFLDDCFILWSWTKTTS